MSWVDESCWSSTVPVATFPLLAFPLLATEHRKSLERAGCHYPYCGQLGLHLSAVSAQIASRQSKPENLPTLASHVCYRWYSRCRVVSRVLDRSLATVPCVSSPMSTLLRSSSASEEHCPSTPSGLPSPSAPMSLYYVMEVLGALPGNAKTIVKLREL